MTKELNPIESDFLRPARKVAPADTVAIDLNADVGEGQAVDTKVMAYVSSISVAVAPKLGRDSMPIPASTSMADTHVRQPPMWSNLTVLIMSPPLLLP